MNMNYIKGKLKRIIYQNNDSGYVVALFRVKETNDSKLEELINKTITVTGVFTDVNLDVLMVLYGEYIKNDRFGMQYNVLKYDMPLPEARDSIVEFLSSSFVNGCGIRTAKKIVDHFGDKTLDVIKEDQDRLLEVDGMTASRAAKIYNSIINYNKSSDTILKLQTFGFSIEECSRIYNRFKDNIEGILGDNFYDIKEVVDFKKVDNIYVANFGDKTQVRIYACLLETMLILSFSTGDIYHYKEEISASLHKEFNIILSDEVMDEVLNELKIQGEIRIVDRRIYLEKYYEEEENIASNLKAIDSFDAKKIDNLEEKLQTLESKIGIDYNMDQEKAIITAINNNITIISGGPGTGKTTIINAITKLYIEEYRLGPADIMETIALLAPTGRASKKLATSTNLPAYTIHRYLKWYKDSDSFFYNEYNKTSHKLIIVDEVSMIDIDLFDALLKGISPNVKLILVGDINQLPSVGPGLILEDLINTDYFNYVPLKEIYRQSDNSYIPYLAKEIRNRELSEEFLTKKDDYSFIQAPKEQVKEVLEQIIKYSLDKGIDEAKMQILAPMYKGENGIDNLNLILQKIYNPRSASKNEMIYGDVIFREGDKVLQLVNDLDKNVFNGDIGFIKSIDSKEIVIDFEGNKVTYPKKDLKQIKHAYAITIHKSQGSEFDHVIMPVVSSYYKMLYNKLVYTGVSRAKKSLTIIGDPLAFARAVNNNYSQNRKTTLKDKIIEVYNLKV